MAYKLNKTGDQVRDDLDAVEDKTIYPDASSHEKGLMTKEHVQQLNNLEVEVDENNEALSEFEIRMICR
jgi:hypothetical protein